MDKYQNRYRVASARAQWWDYRNKAAYSITICTKNRAHFFGEIQNGKMFLSPTGVIADMLWYEIPKREAFVELGDFVVMPDHIHGILILNTPNNHAETLHVETLHVETLHARSLQPQTKNENMSAISPKAHSLSTIIRSYKSAVTKHANRLGLANGWQARFWDRIIRNEAEYQRISEYIKKNPENWKKPKKKRCKE